MPFRTEKKNGVTRYKYRYYYYADNKRHDSETGWFYSKEEAELEGKRLKEEKETADRTRSIARRDTLLSTAFNSFIDYLKECADVSKTTTAITYYRLAKTIRNKYMPEHIKGIKIQYLKPSVFRQWVAYINNSPKLGGSQVRNQKTILNKFNAWLADNGYYITEAMDIEVQNAIKRVGLKPTKAHSREEAGVRKTLNILDIEKIEEYFLNFDRAGEFENLYWYCLFMVAFFSGMRVEELVALQWKNVDLKKNEIDICNAITEKEPRDNAMRRVAAGEYKTKNKESNRIIQIFGIYDLLLSDYKKYYQHYFNLSSEELKECFVFPNLLRKDPHEYQKHRNIVRRLQKQCEIQHLPHTDTQMLRHACAQFLVYPEPDGLNYTTGQVIDHFGHCDTKMLDSIYGKMDKATKAKKGRKTFQSITPVPREEAKTLDEELKWLIIDTIKTTDGRLRWTSHKDRLLAIISVADRNKEPVFHYAHEDEEIVKLYFLTHLSTTMDFKEKEWD